MATSTIYETDRPMQLLEIVEGEETGTMLYYSQGKHELSAKEVKDLTEKGVKVKELKGKAAATGEGA